MFYPICIIQNTKMGNVSAYWEIYGKSQTIGIIYNIIITLSNIYIYYLYMCNFLYFVIFPNWEIYGKSFYTYRL